MDRIPLLPYLLEWRASGRGVSASWYKNLWWEKLFIAMVGLGVVGIAMVGQGRGHKCLLLRYNNITLN